MKTTLTFIFALLAMPLFAQKVTGIVVDKFTGMPVVHATVKKSFLVQSTANDGSFSFYGLHFGDSVKITHVGYKPYDLVVGMARRDTIMVYLEQISVMLNNVGINGKRNYQADSLRFRTEFARQFAYHAPTFEDAFLTIDPYHYEPGNYINASNSTASLVGIDLGSIASLFSSAKAPGTILQRQLLADEEINYINRRFSNQKVAALTGLQGDDLYNFMALYRPSIIQMKRMTDYELDIYIKNSYAAFIKTGKPQEKINFNE